MSQGFWMLVGLVPRLVSPIICVGHIRGFKQPENEAADTSSWTSRRRIIRCYVHLHLAITGLMTSLRVWQPDLGSVTTPSMIYTNTSVTHMRLSEPDCRRTTRGNLFFWMGKWWPKGGIWFGIAGEIVTPLQDERLKMIWSNNSGLTRPGPPKGSFLEGKWDPVFP